jgi:hypothetical protein
MTYYAKVVDNLTNTDITKYKNAIDNNLWYYGKINGNYDGESQFIIEFDIWNNEPAFNHRGYETICRDAKNVKMGVEVINKPVMRKDNEFVPTNGNNLNHIDFFYARSLTEGYDDFQLVNINNKLNIVGNVDPSKKSLLGVGDHCIVQTKIKLDNNTLTKNRYNFNVTLSYDFE